QLFREVDFGFDPFSAAGITRHDGNESGAGLDLRFDGAAPLQSVVDSLVGPGFEAMIAQVGDEQGNVATVVVAIGNEDMPGDSSDGSAPWADFDIARSARPVCLPDASVRPPWANRLDDERRATMIGVARRLPCLLAVARGFEPREESPPHTLSRRAP